MIDGPTEHLFPLPSLVQVEGLLTVDGQSHRQGPGSIRRKLTHTRQGIVSNVRQSPGLGFPANPGQFVGPIIGIFRILRHVQNSNEWSVYFDRLS